MRVRSRLYLVDDVAQGGAGEEAIVHLSCLDEDAQGARLSVLWQSEVDARIVDAASFREVAARGLDEPRTFAAYLHAQRWNCVTSTRPRLFQAPHRAGIELHAYQLEPLRKALLLPRVNLFIADDVGLGKTIEAGLILRELLMRQRVRRVVVMAPPSVVAQWREELLARFGLSFVVYDREFVATRRRERGYSVNPWLTHNLFLISHALVRDEAYVAPLRACLERDGGGSMMILDEAHSAAPASGAKVAIDSKLTGAVRELSELFEHRLFLSATPHNGHSNSFTALLEVLDRMIEVAEAHASAPDERIKHLVAWIREHLCPDLPARGVQPAKPARWLDRCKGREHAARVLIFTEYTDTKRYLEEQLTAALAFTDRAEERVEVFHGEITSEARREAIKRAFIGDPAEHPVRVLIATDAAREGVNLQSHCADLFHFDVPWNPSRMEQRNGRIDRKLQREEVVYCHYFVFAQRAEDRVLEVLVEKTKTIQKELGSLGAVVEGELLRLLSSGIPLPQAAALCGSIRAVKGAPVPDELEASRERSAPATRTTTRTEMATAEETRTMDHDWKSLAPHRPLDPGSDAARWSGGIPRTFLQLLADAGTYARLRRDASWPEPTDLADAVADQEDSVRRVLLPGDTQAILAAEGTDGRELDLGRKVRLMAHGVLLERLRNRRPTLEVHPLARAAVQEGRRAA